MAYHIREGMDPYKAAYQGLKFGFALGRIREAEILRDLDNIPS
jgi:hypothetical protein